MLGCNCKGGIVEEVVVCVHVFTFVCIQAHRKYHTHICVCMCVSMCICVYAGQRSSMGIIFSGNIYLEAGSHFFFKSGNKGVV